MITAGQIYTRHEPTENVTYRIRIEQYQQGAARARVVDAVTGKRPREILAANLHESATTRSGQPRRTGYILEGPPDRFAWCFSHGRLHRFAADAGPWCTATWVWLDGSSEAEALTAKIERFGDTRFLNDLPDRQQLAIINGDVPGQKTEASR